MISFADTLVLIGMFALRIGVPILIMVGLVYFLKRLDARWEEEAHATGAARQVEPQREAAPVTTAKGTPKPAIMGRDMPGIPAALPGLVPVAEGKRCWNVKNCSAATREACPAHKHPELACWQARLQAEGHVPETCTACEVFQRYPMI